MKPYKIIEGTSQELEVFEKNVAEALEQGYELAGDLATHAEGFQVKFYQPMLLVIEEDEYDEEEFEEAFLP